MAGRTSIAAIDLSDGTDNPNHSLRSTKLTPKRKKKKNKRRKKESKVKRDDAAVRESKTD